MDTSSHEQFETAWTKLQLLRGSIRDLEHAELERVHRLRGSQTVDDLEAVQQSFAKLELAILDIEETLATIGEATGEIGKL